MSKGKKFERMLIRLVRDYRKLAYDNISEYATCQDDSAKMKERVDRRCLRIINQIKQEVR